MILTLFFLFVLAGWSVGLLAKDSTNRMAYIYATLWVTAGTFAGLVGFTSIIGARIVHDNDMHGWVFYAAPAGAILGGVTASVIASYFYKNYKSASIKCLVVAALFSYGHYRMFRSTQEYQGFSEALQEVVPALIWCGFLLLYGLFLMPKAFSRKL